MLTARQIGYAVREKRKERGLTQVQLAKAASVSNRFLIGLERGDNSGVRLDKLQSVLSVLNLELSLEGSKTVEDQSTDGEHTPTIPNRSIWLDERDDGFDPVALLLGGGTSSHG